MPTWALLRMPCQSRRPLTSAKLPLPPSCPVSVAPAAYPRPAGCARPKGLPPRKPPPPVPRKRPFQLFSGSAIQMRTLSPAGGWVVTAVTRQTPGAFGSTAADSMVVLGSATLARLSHVRAGLAFGTSGFGAVSATEGGPCAPAVDAIATVRAKARGIRVISRLQKRGGTARRRQPLMLLED